MYLWFIRMFQNTLAIPQSCFLKKRSAYMLQIYGRTHMSKYDFNKVALQLCWNHTVTLLFSCKSPIYLQNTFFEEHFWVNVCENTYCSGHPISALWKTCWSQDDVTFIKQGTKNSVVPEQQFSINEFRQ